MHLGWAPRNLMITPPNLPPYPKSLLVDFLGNVFSPRVACLLASQKMRTWRPNREFRLTVGWRKTAHNTLQQALPRSLSARRTRKGRSLIFRSAARYTLCT